MLTKLLFIISLGVSFNSRAQFDVRRFGASGDGKTLDTRAIQAAIDSAHINNGGIVNFSAGIYKIGTLILKSNVELHLMAGATIIGSENITDYIAVTQRYESRSRELYAKYFMIFAENENNISITGTGTIDGNGLKNFQTVRPQNQRPFMIRLVGCSRVILKDVQLVESANWTLHLLACTDVNIHGLTITTTAEGNRDGIDIDACQRVAIANCRVTTTDDAIVMKSTSGDTCRDIAITNCILSSQGSAIKTGTESNGGFKNITVSNCVVRDIPFHSGIELMTVDGGVMQNILVQNITMENVATPFFIRLGIRARPYKSRQYVRRIGNVRDISFNNIAVVNAKLPSSIIGLKHKKLTNISITGYTVRYSEVQRSVPYNKVPSLEFDYPAANMFSNLPAFALYCRDVEGLFLQNIKMVASREKEERPACVFDRVSRLQLISLEAGSGSSQAPVAYLRNSNQIVATWCRSVGAGKSLFEIEGNSGKEVLFVNNLLHLSQLETLKVKPLPEIDNPDNLDTKDIINKDKGKKINGLYSYELKNGSYTIPVKMKKGALQFCVLVLNESTEPRKLIITYKNVRQEFIIDWNDWGWAPFSLLKQFSDGEEVDVRIEDAESNSALKIAKLYIRSQEIEYTD